MVRRKEIKHLVEEAMKPKGKKDFVYCNVNFKLEQSDGCILKHTYLTAVDQTGRENAYRIKYVDNEPNIHEIVRYIYSIATKGI